MTKAPSTRQAESAQAISGERVHHMICIHGAAAYLEEPDSVTVVREHSGLRIEGCDGARAIVSVPMPTTLVFKGSRLAIRSILLDFATSEGVELDALRVFSGSRVISSHEKLGFTGRHRYRQFEIGGHPKLNMPLSLSTAIMFGEGQGYFILVSASAVFVEKSDRGIVT